jgi:hypothetical protein
MYDRTRISLHHIKSRKIIGLYHYSNYHSQYNYHKSPITEHTEGSKLKL